MFIRHKSVRNIMPKHLMVKISILALCGVGAVFKSADSIVLKSFLLRVILQRGFYCSEDSIALISNVFELNVVILFKGQVQVALFFNELKQSNVMRLICLI